MAVQDGSLLDYAIQRPGTADGVGARLRGRVMAVVPALAGAFIALPGHAEGFLPDSQGAAGLSQGEAVTVIVVRAPQGGKGPRLTAHTGQDGPGPPALLTPAPSAVERLLAHHPDATVTIDDPAYATQGATIVAAAWDDAVATQVEALAATSMDLPGGARASIHPTPALVAIDLDTAAASAERRSKAATQLSVNRAALPSLLHALRLRNLSGAIVLDLAGLSVKARRSLAPDITAALAQDPAQPRFLGFTALGLAEILRPRTHPPLHELLSGPHAAALAALRQMATQAATTPAIPLALRAAPDVVTALEADPIARADLARRSGRPLIIRSDSALKPGRWHVEPVARG